MNWDWATSLEHIWRSPSFPMWLTMAAAGFFALVVLVTLLRAEKSVANGALTVITLVAIGIAVAATIRGYGPTDRPIQGETRSAAPAGPAFPALTCVDGFAGDPVLKACERVLFGSAESTAAAVSYAAAQIGRLTALGDVNSAERSMTPELRALRRTIEQDRYGLMAQVLSARDRCTATQCAAFRSLTDSRQIVANMEEHAYDSLIARYASLWNAPSAAGPVAMTPASTPTGRPTNADFPTAASTPPVSIMTPEPSLAPAQRAVAAPTNIAPPSSGANASLLSPRPTASIAITTPIAKKPAPKRPAAAVPAPPPPADTTAAPKE